MAKDMHKLIEGKINVEYRNFSHFEMIDALKNYTQRRQGGTNI